MVFKRSRLVATAAVCGLSSVAFAGDAPSADLQSMRTEMQAMKAELNELRASKQQTWLNERQAEEVKGLIREVLADADSRSSLAGDGMTAGISNKGKIFLQSDDGSFLMNVAGQIQFRWIANLQDGASDEADSGFQVRRAKLKFGGHIADPKLTYALTLETTRDGSSTTAVTGVTGTDTDASADIDTIATTTGSVSSSGFGDGDVGIDEVWFGYKFDDNWSIKAGVMKLPFLRQELTSSSRQLAVDRASVTEFFTLNQSEQVQVAYKADQFKVVAAVSDGSNGDWNNPTADTTEIALTVRGDVLIDGDWGQMKDGSAWEGEDFAAFVGAAMHYEIGDGNNGGAANYFGWTVDGSIETNGLGVMAALMGGHIDPDAAGTPSRDMYGFLLEAGYQVIPNELEPFIRWEFIDSESATGASQEAQIITIGANYYFKKHNAKFTMDLVYVYDGDDTLSSNPYGSSATSSGIGMSSSAFGTGGTALDEFIALRAQFQLLF